MTPRPASWGITSILLGGVAIGSAAIFMRLAPVAPSAAAFWRMALSIPVFMVFILAVPTNRQQLKAINRQQLVQIALVGFWFALDLYFWHWAVARTTVANATLLANLASVFTVVVSFFLFKETFSKLFLAGLVLAVVGAATLVGQNAAYSPQYLTGDFLGLVTACALTGYIITAAKARAMLSTTMLMTGSAIVSAALLLAPALSADGAFIPIHLEGWLPLVGLALVTHVLGQGLIIYGLAHISASYGSIGLLIQPVVAAILAWLIFNETLGPLHIAGAVMILAGIAVSQQRRRRGDGINS